VELASTLSNQGGDKLRPYAKKYTIMPSPKKSKMVLIGKTLVGIVGLEEVFENLFKENQAPDEKTKEKILNLIKKENYIPISAEKEYAESILREYRVFFQQKVSGEKVRPKNIPQRYQGIPREHIPWFPTVYEEKCDGCKKCYDLCPNSVYIWDEKTKKPIVVNPFYCEVGCSGCAEICPQKAITFPPRSILDNIDKYR
jgi:NAD-dependent dihydropyrimidine dehydrogenase PreA subunit